MMLILLCLGTSITFSLRASIKMSDNGEEGDITPDTYEEQRRLEEEEDLLARGPGEEEPGSVTPSLLDVSMEDTDAGNKPNANPNEGAQGIVANPIVGANKKPEAANPTESAGNKKPTATSREDDDNSLGLGRGGEGEPKNPPLATN
jgi:hypothetical protein